MNRFSSAILTLCIIAACGPAEEMAAPARGGATDQSTQTEGAVTATETAVVNGSVTAKNWYYVGDYAAKPGTVLTVTTTGTGDGDLYIHNGGTTVCRSENDQSSVETCTATAPSNALTVWVYGYAAATFQAKVGYTPVEKPSPSPRNLQDFTNFEATDVVAYRDGGTLVVAGNVNRSYTASIRFDGDLSSATRGKFFVTLKNMFNPADPERALERSELEGLNVAMQRFLSANASADPSYATFAQNVETVLNAY